MSMVNLQKLVFKPHYFYKLMHYAKVIHHPWT